MQVAVLLGKVIVEAPVQAGAVVLIQELIKDPEVYEAVVQLAARVVEEESVQEAVNKMLVGASHKVSAAAWTGRQAGRVEASKQEGVTEAWPACLLDGLGGGRCWRTWR